MKIFTKQGQLTFDEMKGSLSRLPKDNRWVQMGDSLPWAEFEKVYNKNLKNDNVGASNRPGRMVIGALIIKHKLGLSDEETIEIIKENPYMLYMCGLEEYSSEGLFDPSLFVTIRRRITIKDINEMTVAMARKAAEKRKNDDENGQAGGDNAAEFPNQSGFSSANIRYIVRWYKFYNQNNTILQRPVEEFKEIEDSILQRPVAGIRQRLVDKFEMPADFGLIPWGQHIDIYLLPSSCRKLSKPIILQYSKKKIEI